MHMTFTDIEEYNLRSIAIFSCNTYSQITVVNITLPKAALRTVKKVAVYCIALELIKFPKMNMDRLLNKPYANVVILRGQNLFKIRLVF